jgi:hypothetical protein
MVHQEPGLAGHPGRHDLERFMQGRLSREEARNVVRHLLTRCPQCLQVTRQLWRLGAEARLKLRNGAGLEIPARTETAAEPKEGMKGWR